jgi:hypothetical protein
MGRDLADDLTPPLLISRVECIADLALINIIYKISLIQ